MPEVSQRSALPKLMQAVQVAAFGGIERLRIASVPVPEPGAGDVLVELDAAGVGPWDALVREGRSGLGQQLPVTLGADGAGTVVAVGAGVTTLRPGDIVFGATNERFVGAYAELALFEAGRVALKPAGVSIHEAAGMPVVGVTAWSMLFTYGQLKSGQRVLVHGAGGAVGSLSVQLARRAGATVIALCRTHDMPFVASLGADEVLDIEVEDFATATRDIDLVIDPVGGEAQRKSYDVLRRGGTLVSVVTPPDHDLAAKHGVAANYFIVDVRREVLENIGRLMADHELTLRIGEILPLSEAPIAHAMLAGQAHRAGKIVLDIRAPHRRTGDAEKDA